MKTAEVKTSSAARNHIQAKRQPFFSKEGQDSFFSKTNNTTTSFFSPTTIQPKLSIGQPNDKYEIEADAMADKVVQRLNGNSAKETSLVNNDNNVQAKCNNCEEEEKLQKKEDDFSQNDTDVQRKSIFESNAESPDSDVQTKPLVTPIIQAKCTSCEEEEKLQKKDDEEVSDTDVEVQEKSIFESNGEQPEAELQTKPIQSVDAISDIGVTTTENAINGSETIQAKSTLSNSPVTIATKIAEPQEQLQENEEELSEAREEIHTKLSTADVPIPPDGEENIQTKSEGEQSEATSDLQCRLNSSIGSGSQLSSDMQSSMGTEFGTDFSNVRVHTGSEAVQMSQDIGAQAFTHGNDIYFNQGKYDTNSNAGKHLLAHELTHTMQQGGPESNSALVQASFLDNIPGVGRARNFLQSAITRVISFGTLLANPLRRIFSSARLIITSLINAITTPIKALIDRAIQWINNRLKSVVQAICNGFCYGFVPLVGLLTRVYNKASEIFSTIFSLLSNAWGSLTGFLNNILSTASQIISDTFNWVRIRLRNIWLIVRSYIPSLGSLARRILDLIRRAYNMARQLVTDGLRWIRDKYREIKQWVRATMSVGDTVKEEVVRYLNGKYPTKMEQLKKIIGFLHDLTRVDWLAPFNAEGLKGDWGRMFFIWLCELSPGDIGTWSRNGDAAMVTITAASGPGYIYDLKNKPYHARAMARFREEHPNFYDIQIGNAIRSGFVFTGRGTAEGNYNQLEWFLGSYSINIEVIHKDPNTKQVFVKVTVSNTSHWESATRINQTGQDALKPIFGDEEIRYLIEDSAREDCGPGGDFSQLFIWSDMLNYDPSDVDPQNRDCDDAETISRRMPDVPLFDQKEIRKGWGRATESVPIYRKEVETEYGTIQIDAEAWTQLLAEISGNVGPGKLRNIIVSGNSCENEYEGEGELHVPLALIGKLELDGVIHGRALWNCVSALGLEGTLRPIGIGATTTAFLAKVRVIYKDGELYFEHREVMEDICFKLTFMLNAILEVLLFNRFSIFEKKWQLYEKDWEKCWSVDALIDIKRGNGITDFDISFKDKLNDVGPLLRWLLRIGEVPGRFPMLPINGEEEFENNDACATRPGNPGDYDNPMLLTWPKSPSRLYPKLYFGGKIYRPKSQSTLKAIFTQGRNDETGTRVKEYKPNRMNRLSGGEVIGITSEWRTNFGTIVGPQKPGTTPGGYLIYNIIKDYGYDPDTEWTDADHIWETQVSGENVIGNLWPLDRSENRSAGGTLYNSYVKYPNSGRLVRFRDLVGRRKKYYFKIKGFNY